VVQPPRVLDGQMQKVLVIDKKFYKIYEKPYNPHEDETMG
jgi:hypothetical protein